MYCTLDDLLGRVPEHVIIDCTDDEDTGQINEGRVNQAIEDATSEINSYCMANYDVPFNPVPNVIKKHCVDIALYNLMSRRGFDEEKGSDRIIQERYKSSVRVLENIARGLITLGVANPPPENAVSILSNGRKFNRHRLDDM
ncbi:gp436 family protein [Desulfotruncus alcoholivorax]|uniref:gp436 family protein n=1 Tax=Desulfotruncus alcoholivorax TaxID=265477 RepID=UPI0004078A73|nr:DUF1320 domain-containing protein [Desulfotruncus alcoholivorax]